MKSYLFCFVLAAALPLVATGQDSEPGPSPQITAAIKTVDEFDSKVAELKREYYEQLAKMDAEYKAQVSELRASLVKDLVAAQTQTAKQNLDAAALILEVARRYERLSIVSPYEADVAADRRVAVFLENRPESEIVERIHILAANGQSLVVNADYRTKVQSGEWKFDGDFITYTEKYARHRFDQNPEEITVPIRYDANSNEYSYPDSVKKDVRLESNFNGRGRLMLGNPEFLIPSQGSADDEEVSDEPNPE